MLRRPPALPRSINEPLNRLATSVFRPNHGDVNAKQHQGRIEIDYSSSLPLQMLLYFNVCFYPCWLFAVAFVLPCIPYQTDNSTLILMIFAFTFKAVIEAARLYLGYAGNLAERMPELTAFCLLTIIFQIPLGVFLLAYPLTFSDVRIAIVTAVEIIYLVFLLFEAITGVYAVRIMVTAQSSRFHFRQFEQLRATNDVQF
jgi:transmembrane protein 17